MMSAYRYIVKHKRAFMMIGVILSLICIYALGIRFGDFLHRITH